MATVIQINVKPKSNDGVGLPKLPVKTAKVTTQNVGSDHNNYRTNDKKSTPNRAVLLHSIEEMRKLNTEGWQVKPGDLGENITMEGVDYHSLVIGSKLRVGAIELEITEVCNPCRVLSNLSYIGIDRVDEFIKTLKGRRGWYAKVQKEGDISVGDTIDVL